MKIALPEVLTNLGLVVPDNISSFVRSVRRTVARCTKKGCYDELKLVPASLGIANKAFSLPLLDLCGVTLEWLLRPDHWYRITFNISRFRF